MNIANLGLSAVARNAHQFGGRRGVLFVALAAAGVGLWVGWPSLVAAGLAPLVLGVLPCVAMCALGLCMKGTGQPGDGLGGSPVNPAQPADTPPRPDAGNSDRGGRAE